MWHKGMNVIVNNRNNNKTPHEHWHCFVSAECIVTATASNLHVVALQ